MLSRICHFNMQIKHVKITFVFILLTDYVDEITALVVSAVTKDSDIPALGPSPPKLTANVTKTPTEEVISMYNPYRRYGSSANSIDYLNAVKFGRTDHTNV